MEIPFTILHTLRLHNSTAGFCDTKHLGSFILPTSLYITRTFPTALIAQLLKELNNCFPFNQTKFSSIPLLSISCRQHPPALSRTD
jgi:hypothetical protein